MGCCWGPKHCLRRPCLTLAPPGLLHNYCLPARPSAAPCGLPLRLQVAHALHILSFLCLQLPVFTYLITQFQSIGIEVRLPGLLPAAWLWPGAAAMTSARPHAGNAAGA